MVHTYQIKPAPILQPFISWYALRIFNTGEWVMPRPMHAINEYYMTFFLKDQNCEMENADGEFTGKYSNSLTTLFTKPNGCSYWKGNYEVFCVQFKSNGLSAIFGIPQHHLLDAVLSLDVFLGNDSSRLTEQFAACTNIYQMGYIMNQFLVNKLKNQHHKTHTLVIAGLSNEILNKKGIVSLDSLCSNAGMSFRNFERLFTDEIGMPPKLYARITRFYNSILNKMMHPEKAWTDITYEGGYYDQAHFIKEVKLFSAKSPQELFTNTPPPTEEFIEK